MAALHRIAGKGARRALKGVIGAVDRRSAHRSRTRDMHQKRRRNS